MEKQPSFYDKRDSAYTFSVWEKHFIVNTLKPAVTKCNKTIEQKRERGYDTEIISIMVSVVDTIQEIIDEFSK